MSSSNAEFFKEICLRMIHVARELENTVGRHKALEIIEKGNENAIIEFTESQNGESVAIKDFEDFKKYHKDSLKSLFLSGVVTESIAEETPTKMVSHVTRCLWSTTFRELGEPELGYAICCHPDFAAASHYHPKIRLQRTKTLMKGDGYCNHKYYWQE